MERKTSMVRWIQYITTWVPALNAKHADVSMFLLEYSTYTLNISCLRLFMEYLFYKSYQNWRRIGRDTLLLSKYACMFWCNKVSTVGIRGTITQCRLKCCVLKRYSMLPWEFQCCLEFYKCFLTTRAGFFEESSWELGKNVAI